MRIKNKKDVDALTTPEKSQKMYWCEELKGFGVRVTPGGVKTYILQTRVSGKQHRISLGRCEAIAPALARAKCKVLIGDIEKGINPIEEKRQSKAKGLTLRQGLNEYLEEKELKDSTRGDISTAFKSLDKWMDKPMDAITRDMVKAKHIDLGKSSKARANLTLRYLRALFNHAIDNHSPSEAEPIFLNPVRKITWFKIRTRTRKISIQELKPWIDSILDLENQTASDYFMFLLLTGLRRKECLSLAWSEINFRNETATLRDTKNHEDHVLPMSDYLMALLTRRYNERESDYVFGTARGKLDNLRYVKKKIKDQTGIEFSPHDLRRTFATIADSLDISAYAVKRLLNHKISDDITAGYIIFDVERLRKPMQKITDCVLSVAEIEKPCVITLADYKING